MQLRSTTRLPGRYRDDRVPELPAAASFVYPNTPFNPNLPPAAFPTLEYPRPARDRTAGTMAVPGDAESPESELEQVVSVKRATVFHGGSQPSPQSLGRRLSSGEASEEVGVAERRTSRRQGDVANECVTEPGDYGSWGIMTNDDDGRDGSPQIGLNVYKPAVAWLQVADGLKLIITMELTAVSSFADAMKQLLLTDEERIDVVDLFEREIARQEDEEDKITKAQALQLSIIMSGDPWIRPEALHAPFEDLCGDLEDPPTFIIKKTDILLAQQFLDSVKLGNCGDRLWRYEGVAQVPMLWNVLGPKTSKLSNAVESNLLGDDQNNLQNIENEEIGLGNGERRKREVMVRKADQLLSGEKPVKRRRAARRVVASNLPSRLRNSYAGDDLEETVALGPPAMQPTFSLQNKSAPPSRQLPVKDKTPITPRLRFVNKSPAQPLALQTSPNPPCYTTEHTPDPETAREQTNRWPSDQVGPNTPLPPPPKMTSAPLSRLSRAPKARLTISQRRLAQTDKILGRVTDAKPPIGISPDILAENSTSVSRNTGTKITAGYETDDEDAQNVTEMIRQQGAKVNELLQPVANVPRARSSTASRPKKRKPPGNDDSAYRTSGRRKARNQEAEETSSQALVQNRPKIQGGETRLQQPLTGRKQDGRDAAEPKISGTAFVQWKATEASVLGDTAAKVDGVELLEQAMSDSVAMSNACTVARNADEKAKMMED